MLAFLVIMICIFVGGFYFAQNWLNNYATDLDSTTPKSASSSNSPKQLAQLKDELSKQSVAVDKANSFILSSQDYQSQIMKDLNAYASSTGVTLEKHTLTPQPPATVAKVSLPGGLQSNYMTITLGSPVSYIKLIKFLRAIETNIPKIRLTGVSISHTTGPDDSVSVEPLIIEVYTR